MSKARIRKHTYSGSVWQDDRRVLGQIETGLWVIDEAVGGGLYITWDEKFSKYESAIKHLTKLGFKLETEYQNETK